MSRLAKSELRPANELGPFIARELVKAYMEKESPKYYRRLILVLFMTMVVIPTTLIITLATGNVIQYLEKSTRAVIWVTFVLLVLAWIGIFILITYEQNTVKNLQYNWVIYTSTNKCESKTKYEIDGDKKKLKFAMFDENKIELLCDNDYDRLSPGMGCLVMCIGSKPKFAVISDFKGLTTRSKTQ